MKTESAKQRFLDARDLLLAAREQYEAAIGALRGALACADVAMSGLSDEEAARQVAAMRAVVARLPRAALDPIDAIADTMEVLAHEITASEEHVPAGVS